VPLRIHALNVGVVVLALGANTGTARRVGPGRTADQQTGSGPDRSTITSAQRGTRYRTDDSTDRGTGDRRLLRGLLGRPTTDLEVGELTTIDIICVETFDALAGSR